MKIKSIQLKNFKRFTDLTISNIPEDTKLVLLIGANGSGKSSLFDAFRYAITSSNYKENLPLYSKAYEHSLSKIPLKRENDEYYSKVVSEDISVKIELNQDKTIDTYSETNLLLVKKFIGRSSNRIIPKILHQLNTVDINQDEDTPLSFIENDYRFQNDLFNYIQGINKEMRSILFETGSDKSLGRDSIFKEFIQPLNDSLRNIFGENHNNSLAIIDFEDITLTEPAKLIFQKGASKINYDLLSHGEKQVIILLLNFIVRKWHYKDAIIYIDEMDCHLNTTLQESLLKEIVENWIPEDSQLWTASHALGFIDYARKIENGVIIDFDSLNFDVPQVITPQSKEILDVYDIAIPKSILSQLFSDKKIVFCENKNDEYYNLMGLEKTLFVGVKDSRDVFLHSKNDKTKFSLRDRDFLTDGEIRMIQEKYPNHRILKYHDFENYLYHPENIAALGLTDFDKDEYQAEILRQKKAKIHYILPKVESARKTYEEFKTDFKPESTDSIVDDFISDEFERYYKFFDMKVQFNRSFLSTFNLKIKDLASTQWFKTQIKEILQ